jgi:outer membrane receptor protein involved in Fe transport
MKASLAVCIFCVASFSPSLNAQNTQPQQAAAKPSANTQSPAGSSQPPAPSTSALTAAQALAPTIITVTASRSAEEVGTEPQSQNFVSTEMLERREPTTPTALLREEPGIFTNLVLNQGSPIIRGQIGNRVLYLWNGMRINNGASFPGPNGYFNEFPLGAIDHMEVVRGPGAVEYGSDAVGGVINIISKEAEEFAAGHHFGGAISSHYGSVNNDRMEYGDFWGTFARANFIMGVTGQDIGNYSAPGIGQIKDTSLSTQGGYFDGAYKVAEKQVFHFSWIENVRLDVFSYTSSKLNSSGVPRTEIPYEERGIGRATYDIKDLGKWSNDLQFYSYFEHFRYPYNYDYEGYGAFSLSHSVSSDAIFGGGGQNSVALGKHGALTYGGDYRSENIWSGELLFTYTDPITGPPVITVPNGQVPPGTLNVFDAFAVNRWEVKKLTLTLGGRIESIHLQSYPVPADALTPFTVADLTVNTRWNPVTGSAGAVYKVTQSFSLTGNIASSFRAPSFSDLLSTAVPQYASGLADVPSPGLKPELATEYEAGGRWSSPHLNLNLTGYVNAMRDVVVSQNVGTINIPGVGVVTAEGSTNSDTGYVRGIEMAATVHINSQWNLVGNLTTTKGEDTQQNVPLRFIAPTNGFFAIDWESTRHRYWAEATTLMVDRLRHSAPGDQLDAGFSKDPGYGSPSATNPAYRPGYQIPGYNVASLRFGTKLFQRDRKQVALTLDLTNLLNQPYREAYSQQELLAPGFGAVIGGKWSF